LLLTLLLAEPEQSLFQMLRNRYFPPERNLVPAHVSLFHALPGAERENIVRLLRDLSARQPAILVEPPRPLGRGVAFPLHSPDLLALRARLADPWSGWLTRQDREGFRPHVTVQNKVTPEHAQATLATLQRGFVPWWTSGTALVLWRYLGGPWERLARFDLALPEPPARRGGLPRAAPGSMPRHPPFG
jgi:2'-5' RNA ligase superfamily protein